jgi:putative peptide zinc metalloprotease protein
MNLTRALDVALPEIPARVIAERCPRLHPDIVHKEHIVDGRPLVRICVPGVDAIFSLTPQTWELARLFDGHRDYEEVAEAYFQKTGEQVSLEELRELADDLESIDFWYKTAQEKNIALLMKSAEERRNVLKPKSRWGDLGFVVFPAFNPDEFLVWLDSKIGFVFTWWFTILTLCGFAVTLTIFVTRWDEISRDTMHFFNFADKTWLDLAVFWGITLFLSAVHETAHGVTCRHYGGRVSSMGFALVYLTPAFYTDTSEGVVVCGPLERIFITIAGVWSELYICTFTIIIWWGTPPSTGIHDFAYVMVLMTGIATVLVNWNPLMKLDGYHILCDAIGILDLKENSTAYVSAWVKKNVWRLPVEVPYVPKRRRLGFAVYAITSGIYSYTVLYILARFVGNIFRNFNPEWSFIPELATGALIFRSRIGSLVNFMKFVYLDKKDRLLRWLQSRSWLWAMAGLAIFMMAPVWRETIGGRFILEAADHAVIRTQVAGRILEIYVNEGQSISQGQPVALLNNLGLDSKQAQIGAEFQRASAAVNAAAFRYGDTGAALTRREQLDQQRRLVASQTAELQVKSPITGIVTTPRLTDLMGAYVKEGTEVAEVDDIRTMRARIYVSEFDMHKYRRASQGSIKVDGMMGRWTGEPFRVSPMSSELPPGVSEISKFKGMRPPIAYEFDLLVGNPEGRLKPGMVGSGQIYGQHRSLAGFAYRELSNFLGRKVW